MDTAQTIVVDIGSGYCKAGFSTDKKPRSEFPSIVGNLRHKGSFIGCQDQDTYAGNQAMSKIGLLNVQYPIKYGFIANWNDFTTLLRYTFEDELRVNYAEHPLILTESSRSDQRQREKLLQVIFETFQVPSFYLGKQPIFSIYSSGQKTGISVDIGYEMTQIVPVVEGSIVSSAMTTQNFGGKTITDYFLKALKERGCALSELSANLVANEVKEKLGYVALDFENEVKKNNGSHGCDTSYQTQDGDEFKISDERYNCPELLFSPQINKLGHLSLQKVVYETVMKCESNVQNQLFDNIVLCGGSSLFNGLPERFKLELKGMVNKSTKINLVAPANRNYAAWMGAAAFASLPDFAELAIKSEEYRESGAQILTKKCQ